MKKLIVAFLVVCLAVTSVFAQSISEKTEGMQHVIILNNSFEGLKPAPSAITPKNGIRATT